MNPRADGTSRLLRARNTGRLPLEGTAGTRCGSWEDPHERVLGDAEIAQSFLPVGVRLEVDASPIAPPRHCGARQRDLRAAVAPAPVQHVKSERVLAEIEVRLSLDANVIAPCVREVSLPPPHPIVAVVVATADGGKSRLNRDVRIAKSE